MDVAPNINREFSLQAMWHAFRARRWAAENLVAIDTGVVHDLLNARYYDSARGQFISQDPVFVGDPKQQTLQDPQSLNSYSYSGNNPITKEDPSGRCLEDGCVVEAGAIGGLAGLAGGIGIQYLSDVNSNIQRNGLAPRDFVSNLSSPRQYAASGSKGAVVGATAAATAAFDVGIGIVGAVTGGSTGVTDYLGDRSMGQKTDWGALAQDTDRLQCLQ
jgi:RHS repeat-associated protein